MTTGEGGGSALSMSESESHSVVSDSLQHHGLYSPWNSPGQNTGVGSLSLLQGIESKNISGDKKRTFHDTKVSSTERTVFSLYALIMA